MFTGILLKLGAACQLKLPLARVRVVPTGLTSPAAAAWVR